MTQLTAGADFAFDTSLLEVGNLLAGTIGNSSSTGFQMTFGDGNVVIFSGSGITYDGNGNPNAGTLTGIEETYYGVTRFTMTGLNVDVPTFVQWVHTDNNAAAMTAFFGGSDSITGSAKDDFLDATTGNDLVIGGDGADTISGGDGNDHIFGKSVSGGPDGADQLSGGGGSDYLQGNAGNDTIDGGGGSDRINGGANDDLISGGIGNDSVNGNLGNDTIDGGDGNDFLRGGKDQDSIAGGTGDDQLLGDLGNDTLIGGTGYDILTGGDGTDQFKFAAGDALAAAANNYLADTITDYTDGTDKIALGFTVSAVLSGGPQATASAAASSAQQLLDNHAGTGEVAAVQVGNDTYLFFAGDGGATVDSAIKMVGVAPGVFDTTDFV